MEMFLRVQRVSVFGGCCAAYLGSHELVLKGLVWLIPDVVYCYNGVRGIPMKLWYSS